MNITSCCAINKNGVYLNDKVIFEGTGSEMLPYFDSILKYFDIKYPKFVKMDALSKLGFLTAEVLLNSIPWVKTEYLPFECGTLMSNSSSSLNTDFNYWKTVGQIPSPSVFVYTLPNVVNAEICIRNGFKGENMFFIGENFVSSGIIEYANSLFTSGNIKFCLCGWVELLKDNYQSVIFAVENKTSGIREFLPETINALMNKLL
ncbi:MAG: hypothetical protein LBR10_07395 [Prevotellaceae bacterium]|jgi:3-oxoacyl-(acyl-carrier-protein) synthase|nr:hypothetical protein [Prevotellaceae bacterium]